MSLAFGANIRLQDNDTEGAVKVEHPLEGLPDADDAAPEPSNDDDDRITYDDKGSIIRIEHADGSVTISTPKNPIQSDEDMATPAKWYENLAEKLDDSILNQIAEDILRGIKDDENSRRDWISMRAEGIRLLGLYLESVPAASGDANSAGGVEGTSRVRHPLLLEACLRFQANARGELLPTDGPVKVRDDENNNYGERDELSEAYENDFNHFLTVTATEYYPDTDRMLFLLGFGGTSYKKVYFCPLRNRPTSEAVKAEKLIVNENATDLQNAKRVTHEIDMTKSLLRRMQLLGIYRDIDLGTPMPKERNEVDQEISNQQGTTPSSTRVEDRDYTIYECYCDLDIPGYEHKFKGKISGLEVPYRVTIDSSSRQILSIVRNYAKTDGLPIKRKTFVKYTFVPGLGFHDIGLVNILGNTTNAVTAVWRELIDLGMFACFPGFIYSKPAGKQNTTIFRIPPGGGQAFETQGMSIDQVVKPLPYTMQHAPALMELVGNMVETGQRVGGSAELMVAEGKADAPVGTMLAQIEQAQKLMNSVHKRLCTAQKEEFELIAQCFREHPDSFWSCNKQPSKQWDQATFLRALDDCNLTPQADPNTSSHTHRLVKVGVLKGLAAASPTLYDPIAVEKTVVRTLGFGNPEQFLAPPSAMSRPPPELELKKRQLDNETLTAQSNAALKQAQAKDMQQKSGLAAGEFQLKAKGQEDEQGLAAAKFGMDAQIAAKELRAKEAKNLQEERIQLIDLAQNVAVHPESAGLIEPLVRPAFQAVTEKQRKLDGDDNEQ